MATKQSTIELSFNKQTLEALIALGTRIGELEERVTELERAYEKAGVVVNPEALMVRG